VRDCNRNGIPDTCEIAQGLVGDCNGNGIPDTCELAETLDIKSLVYTPVGYGYDHTFTLNPAPPATGDVTIHLWATGDLNYYNKNVAVYVNDALAGTAFTGVAFYCDASEDQLTIPQALFNAAADGGAVEIKLVASDTVNATACPASRIQFQLTYPAEALERDCNANGILDECDIAGGRSADADHNGIPDECMPVANCPGDCNCDGLVNWRDIDYLIAGMNDNQVAWQALFGVGVQTCAFLNCDTNLDQHVSWRDIDPFIVRMNTVCP